MNSYNLGGHSGCAIYLIENDDGSVFVRKISKDISYNERLKIQCKKQAEFKAGSIKAPAVYNSGINEDGLFYFDMEYISGITLAEYIKSVEIGKVHDLVSILVDNLVPKVETVVDDTTKDHINSVFAKKFETLTEQLSEKQNHIIDESLSVLKAHDWSSLTPGNCHGDMTLENIIIKNGNIYFIDFLDSFYDSWVLDIGTLLQDVQVMWSYRYNKNVTMNTVLRLIVFRDLLLDEIKKKNEKYVVEVYYALLQKLIRIYPYTKDELTFNFLNQKTEIVLNTIKKLEEFDK